MPFTEQEKAGIVELFNYDDKNTTILLHLARTITKDMAKVKTQEGSSL